MCEIIKEIVPKHFEITTISRKRNTWSQETENTFKDRDRARKEGKWDEAQEHNNKFRKLLRNDKAKQLMKEFEEDLDLRSKWMGLRMLREGYSQAPYHRNNKEGRHIQMKDRAEEAAKYLSDTQWKPELTDHPPLPTNKVITEEVQISQAEISEAELGKAIAKLKNRKSGGPDGTTVEVFKAMDSDKEKK